MHVLRILACIAVLLMTAPAVASGSDAKAEQVVNRATFAVDAFLDNLAADDATRLYVQNAYGILVFPDLIKGGFFVGAEHGLGVLLVRDTTTGRFGPPTFFEAFGGSFGLQFGGKSSEVLVTIMNQRALDKIIDGDMVLGAEISMAILRVGGTFGAGTSTAFGEDLYVFERTAGLFGGASLSGSGVLPQQTLNDGYWGVGQNPAELARRFHLTDARSAKLREALLRF